jgi:thioredoxin reductase
VTELDLAIIGGGPAGMSAALVAHGNHLRVTIFEAGDQLGGQARAADHQVADFLGHAPATGNVLADAFASQVAGEGIPVRLGVAIDRVAWDDASFVLSAGAEMILARRVLIATGTRDRRLGLEHEDRFGLHRRPRPFGDRVRGKNAIVIGGGDEAVETARWLANTGATVTLVVRGRIRARPLMLEAMKATAGITIIQDQVVELIGATTLSSVRLASGAVLDADLCFARTGVEPNAPSIVPEPAREKDGRLIVDAYGRTSIPGLYAAGDVVVTGDRRYLSHATGTGAIAARTVESDRDRER